MQVTHTTAIDASESSAIEPARDGGALPDSPVCTNTAQPCFTWQSTELLQGSKRVHIAHNGGLYQLQTTRQGKLILTK